MDRANTSFSVKLQTHLRTLAEEANSRSEYKFLKYYQNIVREYLAMPIDSRGLLLYWTMGLGKSIGAISIAIDMIQSGRQVIMLLTKSLQGNMRDAIFKYIALRTEAEPDYALGRLPAADLDEWIGRNFHFVSMNASNMLTQLSRATAPAGTGGRRKPAKGKKRSSGLLDRKIGQITKLASLNGRVLIVDEAHNLFRSITNGSTNALGLYDMVMDSKDLRCVFLTGTPIGNDPFELTACFNMLGSRRPNAITLPESYKDFQQFFVGSDGRVINKGKLQNRLMGLVSHVRHDMVWNNGGETISAASVEFPEELPAKVVRVPMSENQYVFYLLARDKEREEATRFRGVAAPPMNMTKPKSAASSTYKVTSRQLSNYCPPAAHRDVKRVEDLPAIKSVKYDAMLANIDSSEGLGIVYSQFTGVGGLGTFIRYLIEHGWVEAANSPAPAAVDADVDDSGDDVGADDVDESAGDESDDESAVAGGDDIIVPLDPEKYLENIHAEFEGPNISDPDTSGSWVGGNDKPGEMVDYLIRNGLAEEAEFRQQLVRGGDDDEPVGDIAYLSISGHQPPEATITDIAGGDDGLLSFVTGGAAAKSGRKFAVIKGDIELERRQEIIRRFNADKNKHGGEVDLLLLSSTGAEGLDLKNVRHIHIMEPYWTYGRIQQIKSRGIRNNSHVALPPDQRNVATYIYLAVSPHKKFDDNGVPLPMELAPGEEARSTDEEIYDGAVKSQIGIDSFNIMLQEIAIECTLIDGANCRTCAPTNEPLFTRNIRRDIIAADPCQVSRSEEVDAVPLILDGTTYYYRASPTSIFGWTVFVPAPELGGYRPMGEDDPMFQKIITAIEDAGAGEKIAK